MTLEIAVLFAVLAAMVLLFLTEKLPVDLTAFLGLTVLLLAGYVTPAEAFTGFSSPAVITMLSIFVVSGALLQTGVADVMARRLHTLVGTREVALVVTISLLAGLLSAFMNNIAATAVLMPAVASLAARARLSPSRLFMPLAFGAILGGTTTLVGTPPNILVGDLLAERGLPTFDLFDFAPVGLALLAVGTLYMATIGRRLLPTRATGDERRSGGGDLAELYQVRDKLFVLEISRESGLAGRELGATGLGKALGVKVLALQRGEQPRWVPRAETQLQAGDRLLLQGRREAVEELSALQGLEAASVGLGDLPRPERGVVGVRLGLVAGGEMVDHSLRELALGEKLGLVVLAIRRDDMLLRESLAERVLLIDDELLALVPRTRIAALRADPGVRIEGQGFEALAPLRDELFLLRLTAGSPLEGETLRSGRVGERLGLTVAAILRDGALILASPAPEMPLRPGDRLLVVGEPARVAASRNLGEIRLEPATSEALEGRDVALIEVAVAPRSTCVGKTLRQLGFRDRYGMVVVSIWRAGRPIHGDLADIRLRLGDALLLEGRKRRVEQLARDPDWVVLTPLARPPLRLARAPYAIAGLLLMIGMVVSGFQPIHVAAFASASLVLLSGALTMPEAYRAIEWRAIFLVAAVLPVGAAMERTGAAALLAEGVVGFAASLGPYALLAALVVLASLLSQGLDGAPAVVLLTPVVLEAAERLSLDPMPLMMGIAMAASAAFMTPFSHKANLLVMGAGGYRAMDYLRVGTPLTLLVLLLIVLLVPLFFPFAAT